MPSEFASFLETEYQERWDYVRHTETIRYRVVSWFFILTGVLLGFSYLKLPDLSRSALGVTPELAATAIFGMLWIFSLLMCRFLLGQKLNYRRQRERKDCIEQLAIGAYKGDITESDPDIPAGVFAAYYYAITVTSGALLALCTYEVALLIGNKPYSLECAVLAFLVGTLSAIGLAWYQVRERDKLENKIKRKECPEPPRKTQISSLS